MDSVADGGGGRHSRGTIDTMVAVALRFEKKIFPGLRLVNKMTKQFFGKSNGQRITT